MKLNPSSVIGMCEAGGFCSSTLSFGYLSSRKSFSARACCLNSSAVPFSEAVGRSAVQYSIVTTSPSLAPSPLRRVGLLLGLAGFDPLALPDAPPLAVAAPRLDWLRVGPPGAEEGRYAKGSRPLMSTCGIDRVDGFMRILPCVSHETKRSQPREYVGGAAIVLVGPASAGHHLGVLTFRWPTRRPPAS